jgi:hypothetical protein
MRSIKELIGYAVLGICVGGVSIIVDNCRRKYFKVNAKENIEEPKLPININQTRRGNYMQKSYHSIAYTEIIFDKVDRSPIVLHKNVYTDRHWKCKLSTTKEADWYEFYHANNKEITAIISAVNKSILKQLDCNVEFAKKEILPVAYKMCVGEIDILDAIIDFQTAELKGIKEYNNPEEKYMYFTQVLYDIMPSLIRRDY